MSHAPAAPVAPVAPAVQGDDASVGSLEFADLMAPFSMPDMAGQVAVGVSGGADSLALLGLLHEWGQTCGIRVRALIVDHGLRVASKKEAVRVAGWLSRQNIDHHILTWKHTQNIMTAVQKRARTARYKLMTEWCHCHHVSHIFVAHHLDDQAETVLMRLKKGTTLFGLGGMKTQRDMNGVAVCRPLLSVPKTRLVATLRAKGQDWIEDPSNQNMDFERVRIRRLLPKLAREGVMPNHLVGAALGAQSVCQVIDAAVDRLKEHAVFEENGKYFRVEAPFFASPGVVQDRMMVKLLMDMGHREYAPNIGKIQRLIRWMERSSSGTRTLGGCLVRVHGEQFKIYTESSRKKRK